MKLAGKTALVTGASRGIGAATAIRLAAEGAAVIVNYFKNDKAAEEVVKKITDVGGQAIALQADARDAAEIERMMIRGVELFGPVDILVLNAGMPVPFKPIAEMTYDEFQTKVMGELDCFFFPVKAVIPSMIERKMGCIVGVSSGLSRHPAQNFSAHTTAKSAVDGFMKSLAQELGRFNIRANTIAPGLTRTDATAFQPPEMFEQIGKITPLGRVGEPEDVAGMITLLAMDDARFVSGAYIPVSGGIQTP
ncbi:MAG: SDR family oxidoreductase [Candidatus Zixiibacteriota bacterium]